MSKAVLMSTQPKWCEKICHKIGENADGTPIYEKSVDVRKTIPKIDTPFKVYVYCCKPKQILRYVWGKEDYRGIFPDEELDDKKVFCKIPDGSSSFCSTRYAGKVIGEFLCDDIAKVQNLMCSFVAVGRSNAETNRIARLSCLNFEDMKKYLGEKDGYAWHISNLVIYDKPKELSEFTHACPDNIKSCKTCRNTLDGTKCKSITRPPQSWCYVEELSE